VAIARLNTVWARNFGIVTDQFLGTALQAVRIAATNLGGFVACPFRIPPCLDVSYPVRVYLRLSTAANSAINGQNVVLQFRLTRLQLAGTRSEITFDQTWPAPNAWTTAQTQRILLDAGNNWTLDPAALADGDTLGIRTNRNGTAAADNYAQATDLVISAELEYTSRCRLNCCP